MKTPDSMQNPSGLSHGAGHMHGFDADRGWRRLPCNGVLGQLEILAAATRIPSRALLAPTALCPLAMAQAGGWSQI